ncbi:hypothetical protein A3Q56_01489 [Intoshia linei]|uniref:Uncharacterized protein n=1 Tax=Intoshia linei TaxID=1819745 RepID=A0A177B8Y1_9BILA|nr:hypothetical protein A3Q56_01489 [Intoshia linei]
MLCGGFTNLTQCLCANLCYDCTGHLKCGNLPKFQFSSVYSLQNVNSECDTSIVNYKCMSDKTPTFFEIQCYGTDWMIPPVLCQAESVKKMVIPIKHNKVSSISSREETKDGELV